MLYRKYSQPAQRSTVCWQHYLVNIRYPLLCSADHIVDEDGLQTIPRAIKASVNLMETAPDGKSEDASHLIKFTNDQLKDLSRFIISIDSGNQVDNSDTSKRNVGAAAASMSHKKNEALLTIADALSNMLKLAKQMSFQKQELETLMNTHDASLIENLNLRGKITNLYDKIELLSRGKESSKVGADGRVATHEKEIGNLTGNVMVLETALLAVNAQKIDLQDRFESIRTMEATQRTAQFDSLVSVLKKQRGIIDEMKQDREEMQSILKEMVNNVMTRAEGDMRNIKLLDFIQKIRLRLNPKKPGNNRSWSNYGPPPHQGKDDSSKGMEVGRLIDIYEMRDESELPQCGQYPICGSVTHLQCYQCKEESDERTNKETDPSANRRYGMMAATIGAHAVVLRDKIDLLELKRQSCQAGIEATKGKASAFSYESTEIPLKGTMGFGTFAYFRRSDVSSLRLQIEHLRLEIHKKDQDFEAGKLEKISSDLKMLKVWYVDS